MIYLQSHVAGHGINVCIIIFIYLCSFIQQIFIWGMTILGTMLGTERCNWDSVTVWTSRTNCLVRDDFTRVWSGLWEHRSSRQVLKRRHAAGTTILNLRWWRKHPGRGDAHVETLEGEEWARQHGKSWGKEDGGNSVYKAWR